jgi:AraC family transcriptional regulator, regulatory protein of adaptative response / methylphosphotriester-DNA alkyltransferase methyltransferase
MRPSTIEQRRRLYLLARVVIARHYRRPLTLEGVARALACSPRQLTRAYAQCGEVTFREDLLARRLHVAAQLLIEQPAIAVRDVARLVGFRQAPHFAKAFRGRFGLTPAAFRAEGRAYARSARGVNRGVEHGQRLDRPGAGQVQAHQRAPAGSGPGADAASVLFCDLAGDRQAQA